MLQPEAIRSDLLNLIHIFESPVPRHGALVPYKSLHSADAVQKAADGGKEGLQRVLPGEDTNYS